MQTLKALGTAPRPKIGLRHLEIIGFSSERRGSASRSASRFGTQSAPPAQADRTIARWIQAGSLASRPQPEPARRLFHHLAAAARLMTIQASSTQALQVQEKEEQAILKLLQ